MIEVRLYADLAPVDRPLPHLVDGAPGFEIEAGENLRVRDVLAEAGISAADVMVVMINRGRGTLDSPLTDGDRLGLFPAVAGG